MGSEPERVASKRKREPVSCSLLVESGQIDPGTRRGDDAGALLRSERAHDGPADLAQPVGELLRQDFDPVQVAERQMLGEKPKADEEASDRRKRRVARLEAARIGRERSIEVGARDRPRLAARPPAVVTLSSLRARDEQ